MHCCSESHWTSAPKTDDDQYFLFFSKTPIEFKIDFWIQNSNNYHHCPTPNHQSQFFIFWSHLFINNNNINNAMQYQSKFSNETRNWIQEQQSEHRIKPFSLHSKHLLTLSSSSSNTFLLPLQFVHGTNRTSPQHSQPRLKPSFRTGNPSSIFTNSPVSKTCFIVSAPPTCFPLMKTCGKVTLLLLPLFFFSPNNTLCNSFRYAESSETSRSSTQTRNPRNIISTA